MFVIKQKKFLGMLIVMYKETYASFGPNQDSCSDLQICMTLSKNSRVE